MSTNEWVAKLVDECKQLQEDGKQVEEIILYLRQVTGRKILSMKVMAELLGISIREAKELVHNSNSWADAREGDETFIETIIEAINISTNT
jgi:ribosomal protein L7/L12